MINRQSSNGYIPSNDREQQNYLGGYGLSFRNIEEHKHIDKRLYTNIERMTLTYIIHSGFISGYQNRYGDNLKPPTNVYHRMTA